MADTNTSNTSNNKNNTPSSVDVINNALLNTSNNFTELELFRQFLNIIVSYHCKGGVKTILLNTLKTSSLLSCMIAIFYYIKNTDKVNTIFFTYIKPLFYSKLVLPNIQTTSNPSIGNTKPKEGNPNTFEYHLVSTFYEMKKNVMNEYGLPISFRVDGADLIIEYSKIFHKTFIKELYNNARFNYNKFMEEVNNPSTILKVCISNNREKTVIPGFYFESSNYTKLDKIINLYLNLQNANGDKQNLVVLLSGIPGLGKTHSVYYIAKKDLVKEIMIYNMTHFVDIDFKKFVDDTISKTAFKGRTIIMIDEIDKWLATYAKNAYNKKRDENGKSKTGGGGRGAMGGMGGGRGGMDNMDDGSEKSDIEKFDEFLCDYKNNFLLELRNMIEAEYTYPLIFIFCTNNFDTLFEGLGNNHHEALKSMFTNVTFEKCDKNEIIRFLEWRNNNNLKINNELVRNLYYDEEKFKQSVTKLNDDVSMTYRHAMHLLKISSYDIDTFVNNANNLNLNNSN